MTVTRLAWALGLAGVWLAFASTNARAGTVVLVRSQRPSALASEATVRLRGELAAAGFTVRVVEAPDSEDPRAALERAASGGDVEAVVAIFTESPADTIELWVIDRVTGKTVIRSVPNEPASARSAEILSIRALELLRASFLEIALGASRAAPADPPPPPPPIEVARMTQAALDTRLPKTWAIEVGGCLLGSFQGLPLSLAPMLRVERAWGDRVLGRLTVAGLGTRARVDETGGTRSSPQQLTASVAQDFGLMEVAVKLRPGRTMRPFISLGAGALHVVADGQAPYPYLGNSRSLWSLVADAGVGARVALPSRFEVALEVHAQLAQRFPVLEFVGDPAARGGRPTVIGSLTLVAWL
jgi:hypothetical protein